MSSAALSRFLRTTCLTAMVVSGFAMSAQASDVKSTARYAPMVDLVAKSGDERTLGYMGLMMPLQQNEDSLLFGDVRLMRDSDDASEGNIGLGYRTVLSGNAILGGYGFIDRRRSENDHFFTQATIGAEFLKDAYEVRANAYIPMTNEKKVQGAESVGFSGTTVTFDNGTRLEEALGGFDLEGGVKIPDMPWETRAFIGYYHFSGDKTDVEIDGGRVRFFTEPRPWLRLGGEVQHDNIRDTSYYAEVRLRLPLGDTGAPRPTTDIRARMMEPIVRDVDIVTETKDNSTPTTIGVAGQAGQSVDVLVVDNTAAGGGNGTFETPYNTLAAAQAAAGVGDTIYVRSGTGTTGQAAGITLAQNNLRLIGEGVALKLEAGTLDLDSSIASRLASYVIRAAGTAPTITNTGGNGVSVTGNNVTVSGLTVSGANTDGIAVTNASGFNISHNTILNAGDDGIGINITSGTRNGTIANNTVTGGGTDNIEVLVSGTGQLGTSGQKFSVADNTLDDAVNTGLFMSIQNTASFFGDVVRNRITDAQNFYGIDVNSQNAALVAVDIRSNIVTGSSESGIILSTGTGSTAALNASLWNNTSTGNGLSPAFNSSGVFIDRLSAGSTLVADLGGGAWGSPGGNRIFSNAGDEIDIDYDGGILFARSNWWGVNTGLAGAEITTRAGDTVDAGSFLTTDPGLPF